MSQLLAQSAQHRREFFETQAELLERLAKEGQSPYGLYIGCSDARVSPFRLLGSNPGDLFILRNVANIIPPYEQRELGITAVLEFAIRRLQVPHLIIMGHTDCGGIKGLDTQTEADPTSALSQWIEFARPAQQAVDAGPGLDDLERHRAIVEHNVALQLQHVQNYPFILEALEANRLELHGWVYYLRRRLVSAYNPAQKKFVVV
ncbi:MAG: carbonic anhydrase [Anaerolineae bacterium]